MTNRPNTDSNGNQFWYDDFGMLHRDDGPAVIFWNGNMKWYNHGLQHRIDGPAYWCNDTDVEYWINGVHLTEDEFRFQSFLLCGLNKS